ncbi:MAG: T9SS type A sorting domain-containing protein [Candidatus Cloacimonetes bacterium]|nr:T9SS type A sorting domain-containing protein [Candidatus Cloacimonadota bacterium]
MEQTQLIPSNGEIGDQFGYSVAFGGCYILVGANYVNNRTGAAYLYYNEGVTADEENPSPSVMATHLSNYPNPFNPETTISFNLTAEDAENAKIIIYNIKGQKVRTLHPFPNPDLSGGTRSVIWNGKDSNNKSVASGIYLYKLKAGDQESVKRMLLLK